MSEDIMDWMGKWSVIFFYMGILLITLSLIGALITLLVTGEFRLPLVVAMLPVVGIISVCTAIAGTIAVALIDTLLNT